MEVLVLLWYALVQVTIFSSASSIRINTDNNVCRNISDYTTRYINPNCWFDPDVGSYTDTIIVRHGYPVETYKVVTEDGYILTTFRIPHNGTDTNSTRQPIYLQHGATADSNCWTMIGNRSLPFRLVDLGYDVFMGNTRGTKYSNDHTRIRRNSKAYWNYSLDEPARYDITAQLNFVSRKAKSRKIIYVGHSMGGTIGVFHGVVNKQQAEELLAGYIFIAPVVYLIRYRLIWPIVFGIAPVLKRVADLFHVYGLFQYEALNELADRLFCTGFSLQYSICEHLSYILFGFSDGELLPSELPETFATWPEGMSASSLYHYAEIARSGQVRMYDFGSASSNQERYGQAQPPFYNLSEISLPVHIFHAARDPLSTPESLQPFYNQISSRNKSIQLVPPHSSGVQFTHLDFLYAKDVERYFYEPLFELLRTEF